MLNINENLMKEIFELKKDSNDNKEKMKFGKIIMKKSQSERIVRTDNDGEEEKDEEKD